MCVCHFGNNYLFVLGLFLDFILGIEICLATSVLCEGVMEELGRSEEL